VQKTETKGRPVKTGHVVGEKSVTFAPEPKRRPVQQQPQQEQVAGRNRPVKERRSASKNTFRNM
jgi:hypothetical protein